MPRQTGTIIERSSAAMEDAHFALKVALLANRFTQRRCQAAGIDNGIILAGDRLTSFATLNMELAGPMTALAADGKTLEDRQPIPVNRVFNGISMVAVAKQAFSGNGPIRMGIGRKPR